ncbi:hypothetical protein ABG067_001385 [Albugo candida]
MEREIDDYGNALSVCTNAFEKFEGEGTGRYQELKVFTRKEKALLSGRRNRAISRSIQRRNILPRTVENSINYKTSAASKFDRPLRLKKAHEGCFKAFFCNLNLKSLPITIIKRPASMGSVISALVFQPPPPSYSLSPRYFFLQNALQTKIAAFYIEQNFLICILVQKCRLCSTFFAWKRRRYNDWTESSGCISELVNFQILVSFTTGSSRLVSDFVSVNVLAYDYTGYGRSEGIASEDACYEDIRAAYLYLRDVKKIPSYKIILYGRSLGSGPTTHLAAALSSLKQIVAGVILQSPVLSMYRVVFQFRFSMPGDLFCNIDRIADIESPITIIHGTRDEVVPFWHAEILFETCQQEWRFKPLWVTDAGHNNIEVFLRFAITNFSSRVVLTQNFILY